MASEYKHRTHVNAVLNGSGAKYAGWAVLEAMCRLAEFNRPEVTVTKAQLIIHARRGITQIKAGIKFLRDEGSIEPIRNFAGGRGNATTYRLCVVRGQAMDASEPVQDAGKGTILDGIVKEYRASEPDICKAWIAPLDFASDQDGHLKLVAPTVFHAQYVKNHLSDKLLAIAASHDTTIKRLTILEP